MDAIPEQNVHLLRFPIQPKKAGLELPAGGVVDAAFLSTYQIVRSNLSTFGVGGLGGHYQAVMRAPQSCGAAEAR